MKTQEVSQGSQLTPNYGPWMLVTRRRNPVRNGRGSAQVRGSVSSEGQKGKFRQVVDGDMTQKSPFGALDSEVSDLAREDGTFLSQEVRLEDGERNTLVFQAGRMDPTADNHQKQIEITPKKAPQTSKIRPSKNIGIKSSKSLKRQGPSPGNISLYSQGLAVPTSALVVSNGSKFPRFDASSSVRMGNLAQEQGDSNFRRNDRSDKSCSDGHSRLVRSNSVQCLEESISNNPHQHQKRGSGLGSSSLGSNTQPLVEVHNRHPIAVVGGDRDFKQTEEAISQASLRRIRVDHSRKEDSGFQGNGFESYGEPSHIEMDSDSNSNQELRPADLLQRGHYGNSQIHDDMETGVEFVQGSAEEARVVHGGQCSDET